MFSKLKYTDSLINSTIAHFVTSVTSRDTIRTPQTDNIHRIVLLFKDQRSADIVKKHLSDLSNKIDHILQPVFRSRKLGDDLKAKRRSLSHPWSINSVLCIPLYVICAMQITSAIPAVTFTNALMSIGSPPSGNTWKMITKLKQLATCQATSPS